MCESDVWARYPDGQTEKIADDVLYVTQDGDEIILRWFLAEPRRVRGRIVAVDAVKHVVTLEASEPPPSEAIHLGASAKAEHVHGHHHQPHPD